MRRFLILGHKAAIDPDFTLNDLPGAAGRLDVLCRAIGASLFLSHGIRRDVETNLLLQDQIRIRISGERVKRLNPDERSTAALIKHALKALAPNEVQSTPGIFIAPRNLSEVIEDFLREGAAPVVLHEDGDPAETFAFPHDPAFVLSDHTEFSDHDQVILSDYPRISLGSTALHTSQAITITHYLLDQRERDLNADLVLVHKVWSEPKAQLIKTLLEDFGISVNMMMQAPPSLLPMTVDGLAEVRILVHARDLARAKQIITDYFESAGDNAP